MPLYQQPHWSVELPDDWNSEREDESTLFRRHEGSGTLAVTLLCDEGSVTQEVLAELASSTREEGHAASDIKAGDKQGLYFAYEEEGTAWREWYLATGNCVFFVSYDCPQGEEARESVEVDRIVAALTLKR